MSPSVKTGGTVRENLEQAANAGSARARAELEGPECPDEVAYLVAWSRTLYGRCGVLSIGMGGGAMAPLSFTELEAWTRLQGIRLQPYEVDALMLFDHALRNPDDPSKQPES